MSKYRNNMACHTLSKSGFNKAIITAIIFAILTKCPRLGSKSGGGVKEIININHLIQLYAGKPLAYILQGTIKRVLLLL